ncbi:hypothetical protein [Roseibium sp.]|uniref:DUF7662 domain-containing protein n=1 Tax=Roseibium sp. TaxID=1936156 RepID=UPI003A96D841
MSKYDPLREHLARLDDVVWAAKLADLEQIIGSGLPKSAREHRTWWANSGGSLVHQNAWLDAGWRVERTDLPRDVVVFRRLRIGGTSLATRQAPHRERKLDVRNAAEKALSKAMPDLRQPVTVTLRAEWTSLGEVHKLPCSSSSIPMGAAVVRIVFLRDGKPEAVLIDTDAVQPFYRALRLELKELAESGAQSVLHAGLLGKLKLAASSPMEIDVVQAGNAWLLTDGRGRKANLEDMNERAVVAQLLALQERQSGLPVRLQKV